MRPIQKAGRWIMVAAGLGLAIGLGSCTQGGISSDEAKALQSQVQEARQQLMALDARLSNMDAPRDKEIQGVRQELASVERSLTEIEAVLEPPEPPQPQPQTPQPGGGGPGF
jgi:ribosomal protein L29